MSDMVIFRLLTTNSTLRRNMYRPRYRPIVSLALMTLAFSSAGFAGIPGLLGLGEGPAYPVPSEKGSRGVAATRREAAKKKRKRAARARKR
jgi:hypothetical protein